MACPDKYGAPCGLNQCRSCSPGYEDLKREVVELRDERDLALREVEKLRAVKKAAERAVKEASYCREEWPGAWAMVALASALDAAGKGPGKEEE